jgi:hypothetical protein
MAVITKRKSRPVSSRAAVSPIDWSVSVGGVLNHSNEVFGAKWVAPVGRDGQKLSYGEMGEIPSVEERLRVDWVLFVAVHDPS